MLYPGYIPQTPPRLLHYGLKFSVSDWYFDKQEWREQDMTNNCWQFFPEPPDQSTLPKNITSWDFARDNISIECVRTLNEALRLHHVQRGCHTPSPPPPPKAIIEMTTKVETNTMKMSVDDENERPKDSSPSQHKVAKKLSLRKSNRLKNIKSLIKDNSKILRSIPTLLSPKFWMVGLWALLVSFFLLLVSALFSRNRTNLVKQRKGRSQRTSGSYSRSNLSSGEVTPVTAGDLNGRLV